MGDIKIEKLAVTATEVTENIESVSNSNEVEEENKNLLSLIRAIFKDPNYVRVEGGIQAYVLPRTDAHQSEYITNHDSRVEFISGFSGSQGYAIITENLALLWTDMRYYSQAENEFYHGWTLMKTTDLNPVDWIVQNLPSGSFVGFDPSLFSYTKGKLFVNSLQMFHINAVPIAKQNLIDLIWENRPIEPLKKLICLNDSESGEKSLAKIDRLREKMRQKKCDTIVFTLLDDIAWILNIRGFDIPYNPLVFSFLIINFTDAFLFLDERKLSPEVQRHLSNVKIFPYDSAANFLSKYHKRFKEEKSFAHKIWLPDSINYALGSLIDSSYTYISFSPVQIMKSIKNDVELSGMRNSSICDSAALVQFLLWINRELELGHFVDERRAGKQIDYYRSQIKGFISPSFETISAVGSNASFPHYHLNETSCKRIFSNDDAYSSYYLFDSGGHYRDGTTDVSRTIFFGKEPDYQFAKLFTLVLRGHIDCALLIFPENTNGNRIDMVAREPLWREGYDFFHGVGHGVGCFLNVHECPPYIGYRKYNENYVLKKGMVVTIEPGYYENEKFGIRIENCYEVVAVNSENLSSKSTNFITFAPLTFVPIQKSLIIKKFLEPKHINWINNYHNRCLELVGKYLQEQGLQDEYNFLAQSCTPF